MLDPPVTECLGGELFRKEDLFEQSVIRHKAALNAPPGIYISLYPTCPASMIEKLRTQVCRTLGLHETLSYQDASFASSSSRHSNYPTELRKILDVEQGFAGICVGAIMGSTVAYRFAATACAVAPLNFHNFFFSPFKHMN